MDLLTTPAQFIKIVKSYEDFISTKFSGKTNAVCWHRYPKGNFEEIANKLSLKDNITEITLKDLNKLHLTNEGELAKNCIVDDFMNLTRLGVEPSINLLKCYDRDKTLPFISTDVYSFHVDSSPYETATYLCTYFGASSDIISNDEVIQKIQIREIREQLLSVYNGSKEAFNDFIKEYCFDLHYEPLPNAKPINLGNGHLWKLSVLHPQQEVLPCVHRAPQEHDNKLRLMLIA